MFASLNIALFTQDRRMLIGTNAHHICGLKSNIVILSSHSHFDVKIE